MSSTHVIIVGAGIAGLAAAAAMRSKGIQTTVLEQASQLGEVGTGLQIGPNATSVLYRIGLRDEAQKLSPPVQELVQRRWDGQTLLKTTLGAYAEKRYGAPYLHFHRADLHSALLRAATGPGFKGPSAVVVTDATVVEVDEANVTHPVVVTASGERYDGDVVVGADGIRSRIRDIIGSPSEILDSGDMAFRTLIDGKSVRDDPVTRFLVDWQATNIWFGHNRHLVVYPIREMSALNIVGIVPISSEVSEQWRQPSTDLELRDAFRDFDNRVSSLLAKPKSPPALWALKYQKPFNAWSRGHVALVGDAAHAMVPYVSQGASQAIEDGYVLAEEIAVVSAEGKEIAEGLVSYRDRRIDRAHFVQEIALSKHDQFHLPDGPEQAKRDKELRYESQPISSGLDYIYAGTPLNK